MVSCAASAEMEAAAEGAGAVVVVAAPASGRAGGGREPEGLQCPRCDSVNTKFCYYNNYNLSQPRYFCRACRRYWTRGGALRNVPVGGGTRKPTLVASTRRNKRPPAPAAAAPPAALVTPESAPLPVPGHHLALMRQFGGLPFHAPPRAMASPLAAVDPDRRLLDLGGSFTSLMAAAPPPPPDVHFSAGFLVGGLAPAMAHHAPAASAASLPPPPMPQHQQLQQQVSQALPDGLIWSMGWPDLSI
ncbi:unnamed protein product [Urochloa decumbens]|uniref:Dof zinc finger protein n=1 Tax=Urochloa decumbens TaxID=240449 RepID=A0ABC9AF42_9POAL